MVYKAKIYSLFTSYKYLQDLKTGFKHLGCASMFKPVFKSSYSVNKLYMYLIPGIYNKAWTRVKKARERKQDRAKMTKKNKTGQEQNKTMSLLL